MFKKKEIHMHDVCNIVNQEVELQHRHSIFKNKHTHTRKKVCKLANYMFSIYFVNETYIKW